MAASPEHLKLAQNIRKVHEELRILARDIGPDEAWKVHSKNVCALQDYADSMLKLATKYWDKNNKGDSSVCRIGWIAEKCWDYFHCNTYKNEYEKELRLLDKHSMAIHSNVNSAESLQGRKIRFLDVGSCYNPFKIYDFLDVIAIDLCPAGEGVIKCDFLNSTITTGEENFEVGLFRIESFDAVALCLLLEYLPTPDLRYNCVQKVAQLLKPGGVMFILSPDSSHESANSRLMKMWRIACASLGLSRIAYEKLKHLHCMIFRKNFYKDIILRWYNMKKPMDVSPEKMFAIPQDFNSSNIAPYDNNDEELSPESKKSDFLELPFFVFD